MDNLFGPLMIVGVLAIMVIGFLISRALGKKRQEALREVAATLGFASCGLREESPWSDRTYPV